MWRFYEVTGFNEQWPLGVSFHGSQDPPLSKLRQYFKGRSISRVLFRARPCSELRLLYEKRLIVSGVECVAVVPLKTYDEAILVYSFRRKL